MIITKTMRTFLTERIYSNPRELAEENARWTNKETSRDEIDVEDLAARLACWVASEANAYVNIDDQDDWPLIALIAELAAMAMLAQRRALGVEA